MLRTLELANVHGRCGMIVPLSLTFSEDFSTLRSALATYGARWFSSFDNIPAAVFSGVSQRCTIWLSGRGSNGAHSTPMYRWRSAVRPHLVELLRYTSLKTAVGGIRGIPKVGSAKSLMVLNAIAAPKDKKQRELFATGRVGGARLGFSQAARNFVSVFREDPPCLDATSLKGVSPSKIGYLTLASEEAAFAAMAALLGECYFHYWLVQGDGFDVTSWVLKDYLGCINHISEAEFSALVDIGKLLHVRRHEALAFKKNAGKFVGNFNYRALHNLTRRADLVLMKGLQIESNMALSILNDVQRVLAINEFAGEKGIPPAVKKVLRPLRRNVDEEKRCLDKIDETLRKWSGLKADDYDFLLNRDVVLYDAAADEDGSELAEVEDG